MSTPHEEDLDLPPLDGETEEESALPEDEDLVADEEGNALDDVTGDDDPVELDVEGAEGGWLEDSEEAGGDIASFDVAIGGENAALLDDLETEGHGDGEEFAGVEDITVDDGGEEGPLAEDDSIKEEELPALDADDEDDVPDDALYDRSLLTAEDELPWDDRAWARALAQDVSVIDQDDSDVLAVPGDDSPRDVRWRALDELGNVVAASFVPGGSVVLAIEKSDRTLLVRILTEGEARIIAEIEGGEEARVTHLKWDVGNGWIVAFGPFGVQAFRPA